MGFVWHWASREWPGSFKITLKELEISIYRTKRDASAELKNPDYLKHRMSEVRQTRNGCWMILNAAADAAAILFLYLFFRLGFVNKKMPR